jgi:hypothetical protein
LQGFPEINEIRLINNAIKHDGKVNRALAAYPGWVIGDELKNLDAAFSRLAPGAKLYMVSLCNATGADLRL